MTFSRKNAHLYFPILIAAALMIVGARAVAGEPKDLIIQRVEVVLDGDRATAARIIGINFPEDGEARVSLAGLDSELPIVGMATDTMIDVELPDVPAGEYRLSVYKTKKGPVCKHGSSKYCDEFDFTIGLQGPQGDQGVLGERGLQGDKGIRGEPGPPGDKGPKGEVGPPGLKGPKGDKGLVGDRGPEGNEGKQGEQGIKGATGDVGPKGPYGEAGPALVRRAQDALDYVCYDAEIDNEPRPGMCYLGAGPGTINFFVIADTQFGYGVGGHTMHSGKRVCPPYGTCSDGRSTTWDAKIHAEDTIIELAQLIRRCEDCTKILPVLGDLTSTDGPAYDGFSDEEFINWYQGAHREAEKNDVKVIDGLGNHDATEFDDDGVSFSKVSQMKDGEDLLNKGWSIYHHSGWGDQPPAPSKIDVDENGDCYDPEVAKFGFNTVDAHYCTVADAYYYTLALSNPAYNSDPADPVAFLVQLHNEMGTPTAVNYLYQVKMYLKSRNEDKKPIFLVGHKLDLDNSFDLNRAPNDDSTNAEKVNYSFRSLVKSMPVAAILYGHYACEPRNHCDATFNNPNELIDNFGISFLKNSWNAYVPKIMVDAAQHDIFWGISLDTVAKTVSFKRFWRANIWAPFYDNDFRADFRNVSARIGGHNLPITEHFLTCGYADPAAERCDAQTLDQTTTKDSATLAAITRADGLTTYLFYENGRYSRNSRSGGGLDRGYPAGMPGGWRKLPPGWNGRIDAALAYEGTSTAYMFKKGFYVKLVDAKVQDGYPKAMPGGWTLPEDWDSIDAAFYYPPNNTHYFFRGNQYARLTGTAMDPGYPVSLPGGWVGMPQDWWTGIDAATHRDGHTYMFKGDKYIRFTGTTMDEGYPKSRSLYMPSRP